MARGAALGGHKNYAEKLLGLGANIDWIAEGAAMGGHQAYAEALLGRGANINFVANGAASGGHQDYAEELLARTARINWVARGAALGRHQAYAEELIGRGAHIDWVAEGAALGGYQAYAEALLGRGADIDKVVKRASMCGYLTKPQTQLAYLPYFKPDQLDLAIKQYCGSTKLRSEVLKRIGCMSRYMHVQGFTHAEALARTDKSLCFFLLASCMHGTLKGDIKKIPFTVMQHIGSFLAPSSLSSANLNDWSLQETKGLMMKCLAQYQQSGWSFHTRHRKRASSFKNALARTSKLTEMVSLVGKQFSLLSGDNPYEQNQQKEKYQTSTTARGSDGFSKIVARWHGRFNGSIEQQKSEVTLESKSETGEESKCGGSQEDQSVASATGAACANR